MPSLKRCTTCKANKPTDAFPRDASRYDGLNAKCRECSRKVSRDFGKTIAGKAAQRRYGKTAKGKAKRRRHHLAVKNTDQKKARAAVRQEINHGRLPFARTQKCLHCDQQATSWHHHLGYDPKHWLAVIPLCNTCHRRAHGLEG